MTPFARLRNPALVGLTALLVVGSFALSACSDDAKNGDGGNATSTTRRPTTTVTTAPSTTATTAPTTAAESTGEAVWPWTASATRYPDPVAAARGFATDLVGFTDPVMGEYRAGDSRSGEVDVRAKATSAPTTVLVRQIGGSWWVLGSTTADIQVSAPAAGAKITSPMTMTGTSTAFEATVNVHLVADGTPAPLASTFVMGGSMGDMGPFTGTLEFTSPGAGTSGSLVFLTFSAEDGRVLIATTLRVHFA